MNTRRSLVLLMAVAAVSGVRASTPARPEAGQVGRPVSIDAAQSAPPVSPTVRVRGTIDKYDASTRMLSLSTAHGTVQFPVVSTVRIRQGWHRLDLLALQKLSGYRATVRYSESGATKTLESVHVFGKTNERTQR